MATQTEALRQPVSTRQYERVFYLSMSLAFLIIVFAGFARTFFLRPRFETQPLIPLLQLHGFVFSSWLLLFTVQTSLVTARRIKTHMRLGIAGVVIATLMVIIGTITAIIRAKIIQTPPGSPSPLVFLTIPLGDMLVFAVLASSGFYFRRRPDIHKRLMLLATIGILPAAVARIPLDFFQQGGPLVFFGMTDLLILPCLLFDIVTRGRPHRATLLGGLLLVASHPLRLIVGGTSLWLAFATWITQWS
ncbi:MAG TPA: hypothetical protein VGN86_01250 [Pyrinomonadaceae bacterium]|nr:hypothetical protein [Pyrinomonadaceae bacterium]